MLKKSRNSSLPWDAVEQQIAKEIDWLQTNIDTFRKEEAGYSPITCSRCLLRNIAILIISGQIRAREINKAASLRSLWLKNPVHPSKKGLPKVLHGSNWHAETMEHIENHFLHQNYKVVREPNMFWGRADLGIYKDGELNLLAYGQ